MADEEPKIFVDEDWKGRVEREREEARKAAEDAPAGEPAEETAPQPETASFEALVSGLTMQAMAALGALTPRDAKEIMVDLPEAKYLIDMLMILREKTKGNLTPQEQGLMAQTIAELQQGFVVRSQQLQEAAMQKAGVMPPNVG